MINSWIGVSPLCASRWHVIFRGRAADGVALNIKSCDHVTCFSSRQHTLLEGRISLHKSKYYQLVNLLDFRHRRALEEPENHRQNPCYPVILAIRLPTNLFLRQTVDLICQLALPPCSICGQTTWRYCLWTRSGKSCAGWPRSSTSRPTSRHLLPQNLRQHLRT